MKNVLWFLHKPADEREQKIYGQAYRRVLGFIGFMGISAIIITSLFGSGVVAVPVAVFYYGLWFTLFMSILIGWTAVYREELDLSEIESRRNVPIKVILLAIALIMAIFVALTSLSPGNFLLIGICTAFALQIVLVTFAWNATVGMNIVFRILLTVLFPLFTLAFALSKEKNIFGKIAVSIAVTIFLYTVLAIFLVAVVSIVRRTIVMPVYITTDHFEPEIHRNELVYADRRSQDYSKGNFILFIGSDGKPRIGKVVSIENERVTVDTASGEVAVPRSDTRGKVVGNARFLESNFFTRYTPKLVTE